MHSPTYSPLAQDDWPLFTISWGQLAPFSSKLAETLHKKACIERVKRNFQVKDKNLNLAVLALYHTIPTFNDPEKEHF